MRLLNKKLKIRFFEKIHLDQNVLITYLFFFLGPLILSFGDILKNQRLNGDHIAQTFDTNFLNLLYLAFIYLATPLLIFFLPLIKIKQFRILRTNFWPKKVSNKLLLVIFSTLTLLIYFFGLIPVGSGPTNIVAYLITLINPIFLVLIIFFLSFNKLSLFFSSFLLFMIAIYSKSFFSIFILLGINLIYFFDKLKHRPKLQWFLIIGTLFILILISFTEIINFTNILNYIYAFRQDLRGSEVPINPEALYGYAVGRVSSFSSMLYIFTSKISSLELDFLSNLQVIIKPFISDLSINDITKSFNDYVLGFDREWGTILSLPGTIFLLFKADISPLTSILELLIYFLFISILSSLFPTSAYLNRLVIILFLSFQGLLSGILYEFVNLSKSLILISLILNLFQRKNFSNKKNN